MLKQIQHDNRGRGEFYILFDRNSVSTKGIHMNSVKKLIIVTGAASGIGKATVRKKELFKQEGAESVLKPKKTLNANSLQEAKS